MKKLGGIFLSILAFFGSTLNVFADAVEEVVEEKTQTIDKKDYESLKNEVEKKVYNLNQKDDGYIYDYEISITEEKNEVIISETKKVTSEKKFASKEDAQKYYDEYKLEDSWKKGELSIISESKDIEINGNEITMTCKEATCTEEIAALEAGLKENERLEVISKNTEKTGVDKKTVVYSVDGKEQLLNYEDALKIYATLSPAIDGYTIIDKEIVLVKDAIIDTKTFKDIVGKNEFETYDEAKAAADKFLANDDYENKVAVVVAVYDESEKTTKTDEKGPFLSEELAWTALIADATAELEKAIEEGKISVKGKIEEIKKALEDAAKTGKLGLATMELDGKIIYYSIPEQHIDESSKDVKDVFKTKEEAEAALELAKKIAEEAASKIEGATVTFENVEITKNDTAVLDEKAKIPFLLNRYQIIPDALTNALGYHSVKNDQTKTIVIWTESDLEENVQTALEKSLKEENEGYTVKFIKGFNNAETINGIGTFTFTKEHVVETIPGVCAPYLPSFLCKDTTIEYDDYYIAFANEEDGNKVAYGVIKTGETYTLSYTLHTIIETWTYDKTIVNYGFDYIVEGGGATITRSLHQVQSVLAKDLYKYTMTHQTISSDVEYLYTAQFDVYKEEIKTNATVAYKITREKAATGSTGPVEDNQEQTPEVVLPPNTGAKVNFYFEGALLISILVAAISLKKLCK